MSVEPEPLCPACGAERGEPCHPYCRENPDPAALVLLPCGCPKWEVENIGHQEGCSP